MLEFCQSYAIPISASYVQFPYQPVMCNSHFFSKT